MSKSKVLQAGEAPVVVSVGGKILYSLPGAVIRGKPKPQQLAAIIESLKAKQFIAALKRIKYS